MSSFSFRSTDIGCGGCAGCSLSLCPSFRRSVLTTRGLASVVVVCFASLLPRASRSSRSSLARSTFYPPPYPRTHVRSSPRQHLSPFLSTSDETVSPSFPTSQRSVHRKRKKKSVMESDSSHTLSLTLSYSLSLSFSPHYRRRNRKKWLRRWSLRSKGHRRRAAAAYRRYRGRLISMASRRWGGRACHSGSRCTAVTTPTVSGSQV